LAEALAAIGLRDFDLAFQRLYEAIDDKTNFVDPLMDPEKTEFPGLTSSSVAEVRPLACIGDSHHYSHQTMESVAMHP
jgi:hypothetical protein